MNINNSADTATVMNSSPHPESNWGNSRSFPTGGSTAELYGVNSPDARYSPRPRLNELYTAVKSFNLEFLVQRQRKAEAFARFAVDVVATTPREVIVCK